LLRPLFFYAIITTSVKNKSYHCTPGTLPAIGFSNLHSAK